MEGYELTKDREGTYGHPIDNFERVAQIKHALKGCPDEAVRHALEMIAVKLSRLVETPNHQDSIDDIKGYAVCIEKINARRKVNSIRISSAECGACRDRSNHGIKGMCDRHHKQLEEAEWLERLLEDPDAEESLSFFNEEEEVGNVDECLNCGMNVPPGCEGRFKDEATCSMHKVSRDTITEDEPGPVTEGSIEEVHGPSPELRCMGRVNHEGFVCDLCHLFVEYYSKTSVGADEMPVCPKGRRRG